METEKEVVKNGSKVTQDDLEKNGWKNTNQNFGFSQIWKKEKEKMLYDYKTGKVSLIFSS